MLLLGVSVRVFPERMVFESEDWVKKTCPHQGMQVGMNLWGLQTEQKGRGRVSFFSLLELVYFFSFCPQTLEPLVLRLRLNYTTSFPGSLTYRWQIATYLSLYNCVSHSHTKSSHISVSVCVCESLNRVWFYATPRAGAHLVFSVHGFLQARILEWIAMPYSNLYL